SGANPALPTSVGYVLPTADLQDAFHVGQAFERRLALIEAVTINDAIVPTVATGDAAAAARGGIAELRTWAGSTIIHTWEEQPSGGPVVARVRVSGMPYAELGIVKGMPMAPAA